ncbi:recombinase family protein [uncultured Megasphaera sp.]|uniref:recombinase family protein n=1 Tax=uncultured Megasphaera sp. TaxID=165188 RepID=UPI0025983045|nr:recombinase family protein [uncultured Megasphaera sp.]
MKMEKGELIGFQGCLGYDYDPITKRRLANFGEFDKYHIENHHKPIISREDFEKAQEIRLRRAQNRNTIANKDRKREKLSRQYAFSSVFECGFCGEILSRRTWHTSSIYKKNQLAMRKIN